MVGRGALDASALGIQGQTKDTIDPESDALAKEDAQAIADMLDEFIAEESPEDQQEILTDYRANIDRPRKVDFIFVLPLDSHVAPKKGCVKQELFGLEKDSSGLAGSDHYGVLNTYMLSASQCS